MRLSIFGFLSNVQIQFFTWFNGKQIGTDQLGNRYFSKPPRTGQKRERRWVLYKESAEASNVPPEWHGWLHHQTNIIPTSPKNSRHYKTWQKPHQPNMTGTKKAYLPKGHLLKGGKRDNATGDYEAWSPEKKSK